MVQASCQCGLDFSPASRLDLGPTREFSFHYQGLYAKTLGLWRQVWDIATCACKHTLSHHSDKVQSVAWNAAQPSVLLSGGFDQAVFLVRCPTIWFQFCVPRSPPAVHE